MLIRLDMRGASIACQHCGATCIALEHEDQSPVGPKQHAVSVERASIQQRASQLID